MQIFFKGGAPDSSSSSCVTMIYTTQCRHLNYLTNEGFVVLYVCLYFYNMNLCVCGASPEVLLDESRWLICPLLSWMNWLCNNKEAWLHCMGHNYSCFITCQRTEGFWVMRQSIHLPSTLSWPSIGGWESSVRRPEVCGGLTCCELEVLLLLSILGW